MPKSYVTDDSPWKMVLPKESAARLSAPSTVPLTLYTDLGCSVLDEGARMYSSYLAAAAAKEERSSAPSVDLIMVIVTVWTWTCMEMGWSSQEEDSASFLC